jgi:hypothetical protein
MTVLGFTQTGEGVLSAWSTSPAGSLAVAGETTESRRVPLRWQAPQVCQFGRASAGWHNDRHV